MRFSKNPDGSVFEKAKACQRLAVVGTKDAVPALAALLPDEKLNEYARFGLEGIADPAVDEALRDAAAKLHGRPLVGVLDSIGQRKDAKAVELLANLMNDEDATVASAAAGALGRIGTPAAAEKLTLAVAAKSPVQLAAADACLACAERLAAAGNQDAAGFLCRVIMEATDAMDTKDVPKHLRVAAVWGMLRYRPETAGDLLLRLAISARQGFLQRRPGCGPRNARRRGNQDAGRRGGKAAAGAAGVAASGHRGSQGFGPAVTIHNSQQESVPGRARGGNPRSGQARRRRGP